jgi:raffinose/stachyose/melibiose transport system permease protein
MAILRRAGMPRKRIRGIPAALWFCIPALALYAVFFIYPTGQAFWYSLFDWSGLGPIQHFIGLDNFRNLLHDSYFQNAFLHNVYVYVILLGITNVVSLGIAVLLNRRSPLRNVYRAIIFLPVILSPVVTGFIWQVLLSPSIGIVNPILGDLHLGFLEHEWLADPHLALPVITAIMAWQWNGEAAVLFLAGLQNVAPDLEDAARADGAHGFQVFWHVTLPALAPAFTIVNVLLAIYAFRVFDLIYVIAGPNGAPNGATAVMGTAIYGDAFGRTTMSVGTQFSYAMSEGIALFVLVGLFAAGLLIYLSRRERNVY